MNIPALRSSLRTTAACACLVLAPLAYAQALSDPTRPPAAAAVAPDAIPAPGGAQASPQISRLQSVLIAPGRRIAIIDGVTVPLGGKLGDATLIRLSETEAVLRKGGETEVLKLLPGIERKFVKRAERAGVQR